MLRLRSSTVFHLLCWAIGILAAALLAMVALMLYPYIFPAAPAEAANKDSGPPPATVREVSPLQAGGTWHERFWPQAKETQETNFGDVKESGAGYAYVGGLLKGDNQGYAIFERLSDRKQVLVTLDEIREDFKIRKVSNDAIVALINNQPVSLKRVEPTATAKKAAPGRRTPTATPTPTRGGGRPSAAAARETTSATIAISRVSAPTPGGGAGTPSATGDDRNWRQFWDNRMQQRQADRQRRERQTQQNN